MKTTPVFTPNIQTKAFEIALYAHRTQHRKTGERETTKRPYISHPMSVSTTLYNFGFVDRVLHAVALLHDVVEDCSDEWDIENLEVHLRLFGECKEVLNSVKELTDPVYPPFVTGKQKREFKLQRVKTMTFNSKIVLLADILTNLEDIHKFPIWEPSLIKAHQKSSAKLAEAILSSCTPEGKQQINDLAAAVINFSLEHQDEQ